MIEFRDALTDLLEEFGTDDGGFKGFRSKIFISIFSNDFITLMTGELPEGRHLRVENKNFYFDIGQNNRGIYMRISEVKFEFSKMSENWSSVTNDDDDEWMNK